jgi:acyl carrier protein
MLVFHDNPLPIQQNYFMMITLNDICTLVQLQLGAQQVNGSDHIFQDLGADSMDAVNIIATAEEKYDIEIEEGELIRIHTVFDLYTLVRQRKTAIS